jgi:hypothetical protein
VLFHSDPNFFTLCAPDTFRAALPLQRDTDAVSLPVQCLPPTLASAPAVHTTPAQEAAPGLFRAALPRVTALESQGASRCR